MTTVYLVRHGETDGNLDGKFQGSSDTPLNNKGKLQAELVGKALAGSHIDIVYSSPLQRAYFTAAAIAAYYNLVPITDVGLIEINGGLLEGNRIEDLRKIYPECLGNMYSHPAAVSCPGGETMREVYDRAVASISKIVAENKGKTIAITSHGCTINTYLHYVSGKPFDEIERNIVVNSAVNKITYDDNLLPHLDYSNDHRHIPDGEYLDTDNLRVV